MTDNAKRAMKEAEEWLISAKDKLALAETDEAAATVCCSLAIHAIIRANDAISLRFLNLKATRHDDAAAMLSKIMQQGKIGPENTRFLRLLQSAMADKSGADYGKKPFEYDTAKKYVEDAEEFIAAAKGLTE
jgi:HEPN domain-containing protein